MTASVAVFHSVVLVTTVFGLTSPKLSSGMHSIATFVPVPCKVTCTSQSGFEQFDGVHFAYSARPLPGVGVYFTITSIDSPVASRPLVSSRPRASPAKGFQSGPCRLD